jgi:hypothetical protein
LFDGRAVSSFDFLKKKQRSCKPCWFTGTLLFAVAPAEIARKQLYSIIKLLKSISSKSLLGSS